MVEKKRAPIGWALWVQWVLANTVGWIIGMTFSISVGNFLEVFTSDFWLILSWGALAMLAGLIVGVNQWFVLNLFQLPHGGLWARWWVLATVIGWIPSIVIVIGFGIGQVVNFAVSGAIIGMFVGIAQWFALRGEVRHSEWWPIANTVGWMAGLFTGDILPDAVGFVLAGLLSGAITGLWIVWLLKNPVEKGAEEKFNEGLFPPVDR